MPGRAALLPEDPRTAGPYQVVGRLGIGGQGTVYAGIGPAGEQVAIKLLHSHLSLDERARARFLREVEAAKAVARFCTVQVLGSGVHGHRPYIVSEYVDGPSLLEAVVADGPRTGAALDRLAISTATALAAIHRAGVVHRDFKPGNVLLGPEGPVVIDFGIARALTSNLSTTSQVVGSPAYMAPEQISNHAIGPPADMFAWGATMVYAAGGGKAFAGESIPAIMQSILHHEPDLGRLTGQLRRVVQRCLAKDPADRLTAEQVTTRLLHQPTLAPITTPQPPATTPNRTTTPLTAAPDPPPSAAPPDATTPGGVMPGPHALPGPVTAPGAATPDGAMSAAAVPDRADAPGGVMPGQSALPSVVAPDSVTAPGGVIPDQATTPGAGGPSPHALPGTVAASGGGVAETVASPGKALSGRVRRPVVVAAATGVALLILCGVLVADFAGSSGEGRADLAGPRRAGDSAGPSAAGSADRSGRPVGPGRKPSAGPGTAGPTPGGSKRPGERPGQGGPTTKPRTPPKGSKKPSAPGRPIGTMAYSVLDPYCASQGFARSATLVNGPYCITKSNQFVPINMNDVCRYKFPAYPKAVLQSYNSVGGRWTCLSS